MIDALQKSGVLTPDEAELPEEAREHAARQQQHRQAEVRAQDEQTLIMR